MTSSGYSAAKKAHVYFPLKIETNQCDHLKLNPKLIEFDSAHFNQTPYYLT